MNRREKDLMWAADSLLHPSDPHKVRNKVDVFCCVLFC